MLGSDCLLALISIFLTLMYLNYNKRNEWVGVAWTMMQQVLVLAMVGYAAQLASIAEMINGDRL